MYYFSPYMGIVKINSVASLPVAYIIIIWYIKVLILFEILLLSLTKFLAPWGVWRRLKTWLLVERTRQGFFYEKETCLKQLSKTMLWGLKTIEFNLVLHRNSILYHVSYKYMRLKYYVNSNSFLERTVLNYQ